MAENTSAQRAPRTLEMAQPKEGGTVPGTPPPTVSVAADAFVPNLLIVIGFGVALSAWLLFYTDWFAHFGVLLALGGAFTWLGVVSKLLREERLKELQARLDNAVFKSTRWRRYVGAAALGLVGVGCFVGSIDVRADGDTSERLLWFDYDPARLEGADRLVPSSRVRAPRFTTFWNPVKVRVKVGGYPSILVPVYPLTRPPVHVPASLMLSSPVVLLRPSRDLAAYRAGLTLEVTAGGRTRSLPFDGHAVWVGCEEDVLVPAWRIDEWRSANEDATLLAKWQTPRAIELPLEDGMVIEVKLLNEDRSVYVSRAPIHARRPGRLQDFPQVEDLDVPQ